MGRLRAFLVSTPFAALQFALLAAIILDAFRSGVPLFLFPQPLLTLQWLLVLSALAVAWNRWPYDRARTGFLLVHAAPALILLGSFGPRWALVPGLLCLALGLPWMFYLKPRLKAKKAGPQPPAWERATLQGTRILFMAAGAGLAVQVLRGTSTAPWLLVSWPLLALALHLHHVKAWKGWKAQVAGLAAWGLSLAVFLILG
jgi:hypothetical protein